MGKGRKVLGKKKKKKTALDMKRNGGVWRKVITCDLL